MDALLQAALAGLRRAEQLDPVAELAGEGDVVGRDPADALDIGVGEVDPRAEGKAGEDRQLVRRVDAVDVEAGIGLGIAEALRLGQHVVEAAPRLAHGRQDVVAGAVEDAVQPADAVGGQPLAHRADDRDPAGDRGLVGEREPRLFRRRAQFEAVQRDHRLVGGDHVATGADRRLGQRLCRAVTAADQLDHDIRIGLGRHLDCIVEPAKGREIDAAVPLPVARRHGRDHERPAAALRQQLGPRRQQRQGALADGPQPGERDLERRFHSPTALRAASPW